MLIVYRPLPDGSEWSVWHCQACKWEWRWEPKGKAAREPDRAPAVGTGRLVARYRVSPPLETYYPLRRMASQHPARTTLGDVLPRLRCKKCGSEPTLVALLDDPSKGESGNHGPPWAWVVLRGE